MGSSWEIDGECGVSVIGALAKISPRAVQVTSKNRLLQLQCLDEIAG